MFAVKICKPEKRTFRPRKKFWEIKIVEEDFIGTRARCFGCQHFISRGDHKKIINIYSGRTGEWKARFHSLSCMYSYCLRILEQLGFFE